MPVRAYTASGIVVTTNSPPAPVAHLLVTTVAPCFGTRHVWRCDGNGFNEPRESPGNGRNSLVCACAPLTRCADLCGDVRSGGRVHAQRAQRGRQRKRRP